MEVSASRYYSPRDGKVLRLKSLRRSDLRIYKGFRQAQNFFVGTLPCVIQNNVQTWFQQIFGLSSQNIFQPFVPSLFFFHHQEIQSFPRRALFNVPGSEQRKITKGAFLNTTRNLNLKLALST